MKDINWANVEESKELKAITTGGYIGKITMANDEADKEYLTIEYDVAEGEFKDYFVQAFEKFGNWNGAGRFYRSYKETAQGFFKGFITAIENSNKGYIFNNDEKTLIGKKIGIVLGEEEYKAQDGDIKVRKYVAQIRSIDQIKKGDFKVPELKKIKGIEKDFVKETKNTDDLPF